jgi:hypothetical protein
MFGMGKAIYPESVITSSTTTSGGGGGGGGAGADVVGEWRADRVTTVPGYTSGIQAVKKWKNQVSGPDLIPPVTGGDGFLINPSGTGASLVTGPYINTPNGHTGSGNQYYQYSIVTLTATGAVFSPNAVGASITITGAGTASQNATWTIQSVPASNQITFFNYNIIGPTPFSGPDVNNGSIDFTVQRLVAPILVNSLDNGWAYGVGGFGNNPYNYPLVTQVVPGFPSVSGGNVLISGTNMALTTSFPLGGLTSQFTLYFLWSSTQPSTGFPGGGGEGGQIMMTGGASGTQVELNVYYFASAGGAVPYNFITWGTPPPALPGFPFGEPSTLPYSSGRASFPLNQFTPGVGSAFNLAAFSIDTGAPSIPSPNFLNVDDMYGYFTPPNGSPYPPQLRIYGHPDGEAGGGTFGNFPGAGNGPTNAYTSLTINVGVPNIDAPVTTPYPLSFSGFGGGEPYWWSGGFNSNCANGALNITHILIYNKIHTASDFTNTYNYLNNIWGGITG